MVVVVVEVPVVAVESVVPAQRLGGRADDAMVVVVGSIPVMGVVVRDTDGDACGTEGGST